MGQPQQLAAIAAVGPRGIRWTVPRKLQKCLSINGTFGSFHSQKNPVRRTVRIAGSLLVSLINDHKHRPLGSMFGRKQANTLLAPNKQALYCFKQATEG